MARDADPGEAGKPASKKASLETRIALIGVLGALAGTLTGGLVTWVVTQDQLSSQRADARRAERLDAYSNYLGDAARLWTQVSLLYDQTPPPKKLTTSDIAALKTLQATLTREYSVVALVAPERIRKLARALNEANTAAGNALESDPILKSDYKRAYALGAGSPNNFLQQFATAVRSDLGTRGR
jgi:hypothetical protein